MLALIGMFGFALAAVMMTGDEDVGSEEASDTLSAADDSLATMSLTELLDGDTANVQGEDMAEHIIGNGVNNDLHGRGGDDWIEGGDGDDSLSGGKGADLLYGDDGMDTLFGHIGDDMLFGGESIDQLNGGGGDDHLDGGEGDDSLLGSLGDDTLIGGTGADVLNGGSGDDIIVGNDDAEKDYLNGSAGDDILRGGLHDNMNGGDGVDTFSIEIGADAHVDEFDPAKDVIEIIFDSSREAPALSLENIDGKTELHADGVIVARFANAPTIDLAAVRLIAA